MRDSVGLLKADEWEQHLGQQIRRTRLGRNITQAELARRANIDRTTVTRIEHGAGGNINSLVQIARALGREEWLEAFAPPDPVVSPMELLRARQHAERRTRRRARAPSASDA